MEDTIKNEVAKVEKLELEVENLTRELATNPLFRQLMDTRQKFDDMQKIVWGKAEEIMIENDIKRIETDYMNLTIGKRIKLDIDNKVLPNKFYKKVPDTKKISDTFKLTGEEPKGVTVGYKQYLIKRAK